MNTFTIKYDDLVVEYADLVVTVREMTTNSKALTEATDLPTDGDIFTRFSKIAMMMDGAKKGLDVVNKISDPALRAKHKSQVMSNLNRIRSMLTSLNDQIESHWESWRRDSGANNETPVEDNR